MMPKGGPFFDTAPREKFDFDLDEDDLALLEDFKDDFGTMSDEKARKPV